MKSRRLLAAALLLVLWACEPAPESPTPESPTPESQPPTPETADAVFPPRPGAPVVLISIDTLRSDRLPAYGYEGVETPALDAFARDALLFERAYAHYPLTLPSHVALLTGQLPPATGVRDNAGYRLADAHATYLPRLLRAAGYATGAAVSSFVLRGSTGLAQGFDHYEDAVTGGAGGHLGPERDGRRTLEAALRWLDQAAAARPFFLFLHLYEPHLPYRPPEPFRTRYGDTYEGEIAAADQVVGELIAALEERGLYDGALIVLLSDHGEGLMDHQEEGHGVFVYREAIQVPLLLKLPGSPRPELRGARVAAPVQLADVVPTVLEALGRPLPAGLGGTSLLRVAAGETAARSIYAETMYPRIHYGWSELTSLIEGRYHFIAAPEPELYDLEADPAEKRNVLAAERRVAAAMRDRLAALTRPLELPAEEDEATREQLAALGYLAGPGASSPASLPDPKAALARSSAKLETAFDLFQQDDFAAAIPALEALLAENPRMTDAWRFLGMSLQEAGRPEDALPALERALELSRGSPQVAAQIGLVLVDLGRPEEARRHAELAREREPVLAAELAIAIALAAGRLDEALALADVRFGPDAVSRKTRRRLGLELAHAGRHREAIALLSALVEESPDPAAGTGLAHALLAAGRVAEAEPLVDQVLAAAPGNAQALEQRGLIALSAGRPAAAEEALRRSLAANDRQANAWNLLGVARLQQGDAAGALASWQRAVELDPRHWDSLYNLGLTAARSGRLDTARQALRRYVDTAPAQRFAGEIAQARQVLAQLGG